MGQPVRKTALGPLFDYEMVVQLELRTHKKKSLFRERWRWRSVTWHPLLQSKGNIQGQID